jgi:hypothetical protein
MRIVFFSFKLFGGFFLQIMVDRKMCESTHAHDYGYRRRGEIRGIPMKLFFLFI